MPFAVFSFLLLPKAVTWQPVAPILAHLGAAWEKQEGHVWGWTRVSISSESICYVVLTFFDTFSQVGSLVTFWRWTRVCEPLSSVVKVVQRDPSGAEVPSLPAT